MSCVLIECSLKVIPNLKTLSGTIVEEIKDVLNEFLSRKCDYSLAQYKLDKILGDSSSLKFLSECLLTKSDPIPIKQKSNEFSLKKLRGGTWTTREDQRLTMAIYLYGQNWSLVSVFVGNGRNKFQCQQRWARTLDPQISKEAWSKEEKALLFEAARRFGTKSWLQIAKHVGSRTDVQCRYKYKNVIMKSSNREKQEIKKTIITLKKPKLEDPLNFLDKLQDLDEMIELNFIF